MKIATFSATFYMVGIFGAFALLFLSFSGPAAWHRGVRSLRNRDSRGWPDGVGLAAELGNKSDKRRVTQAAMRPPANLIPSRSSIALNLGVCAADRPVERSRDHGPTGAAVRAEEPAAKRGLYPYFWAAC